MQAVWSESARTPEPDGPEGGRAAAGDPAEPGGDLEARLTALRDEVRHVFGIEELRPFQDQAIRANLAGRDLLLVLPTGGGKSLCFQAPALSRPGPTLVVSPLIALMKDQVDGLRQSGVAAGMLTSAQSPAERRAVYEALESGALKLLYAAPERLMMEGFFERLVALGLSSVAIDEAHCISHWGHDFRPEYRQLGALRALAPDLAIHAFTATATAKVRADIVAQLGLREPLVLVGPCDRANLTYRVQPRVDLVPQVLGVLERHRGEAGIVYCLSRKDVERLCEDLRQAGVRAVAYHAGLESGVRREAQEAFLNEEVDVVVATVAFGMGIDRTDVRFVVHAALPKGLEQYSQETGRAGRDGLPAECVLFQSGADFHSWKRLMERPNAETGEPADPAQTAAAVARLGEMMDFATRLVCRHRQLVEHFGQDYATPEGGCGACDVCLGEIETVPDSLVVAQKILSAVVRCGQRYGAAHVTDVLRGAETAALRRTGHDQLSTYGLLRERSVSEIRGWIDQLVGLGHLVVAGDRYPVLMLSQSGVEVMRGQREIALFAWPERRVRRRREPAPDLAEAGLEVDTALFESLRALRRDLARERGVPPYLVFNDRTLAELAARKPRTAEEFLRIKGVGDKKAADLGPLFLERIAAHAGVGSTESG